MNEIEQGLRRHLFAEHPEVEARIEHGTELHRKGTAAIRVADRDGKEIGCGEIELKLIRHGFEFGCNGFMINQFDDQTRNEAHDAAFRELFNLAVIPFYWSDTEPGEGFLRFDRNSPKRWRRPNTDEALDFCERYGITPKGHPLVWHAFIPEWLHGNHSELRIRWERRVREIAERYGERIRNWDVVNEAIHFWPDNPKLPGEHVEFAFDIARKYLPVADMLNYNDYACFCELHGNYTALNMLVKNLLLTGRKVDCIGLQYHHIGRKPEEMVAAWSENRMNAAYVYEALDTYAKLGLPLNISEVSFTAHEALGGNRLEFQADVAERLYRIWFSHPATTGIIYWNLIDDTAYVDPRNPTWNENAYRAGLLNNDGALSPKPVYERLKHLIKEEWQSRGTVRFESGAPAYFRGFHGTYEARVKCNAGVFDTTLLLEKGRPDKMTLTI